MKLLSTKIYNNFVTLCLLMMCVLSGSCTDEILYEDWMDPDGETEVDFVLEYMPLVEQSETAGSRAVPGTSWGSGTVAAYGEGKLTSINSVTVLFYDTSRNLIDKYSGPVTFTSNMVDRDTVSVNKGETAAETKTPQIKFNKTISSGKYYVYAVVNTDVNLNEVRTIDALRSLKVNFIKDNIAKNLEMLGVFTDGDSRQAENMDFEEDKVLTLRPGNTTLHAWARRALAKVTIDFDGSELRNNVEVFIKSARIRTINSWNYLGKVSKVESAEDTIQSVHTLEYGEGSYQNNGYEKWPSVSRGSGKLDSYTTDSGEKIKFHHQYAPCLVCYENMQGKGEKKYQDRDGDGKVDHPMSGNPDDDFYRDGKPFGTYIEVTGYYVGPLTRGPITYRFMLGGNAEDDYNVMRNHHYKVTMKFKGNGNDVDWHVEYKEIPPKIYTNDVYASYAYNQSVVIPVRIVGDHVESIEAEIIENNWHPEHNVGTGDSRSFFENEASIGWQAKAVSEGWKDEAFSYVQDGVKHRGNGFLSLYPSQNGSTLMAPASLSAVETQKYAEDYWNGVYENESTHASKSLGKRVYTDGEFYENQGIKETVFNIEAFTREKNLVKTTGYSGQNYFETGNRIAKVKLTVNVNVNGKPSTIYDTVTVYQARHITNPTAVYRKWNSTAKFSVKLMAADIEPSSVQSNDGTFSPVKSNGPWRVVIDNIGDPGMISLSKQWGDHDSEIDFDINFNGTTGSANKSRFAIISVYYHNYTCVHRIFVRQGYSPEAVTANGCKWHAGNVRYRSSSVLYDVTDPTDEGSLFRYANIGFAISPKNNNNYGFNVTPGLLTSIENYGFGNTQKSWSDLTYPSAFSNDIPKYSLVDALVAGSGKTPTEAADTTSAETNAKASLQTCKNGKFNKKYYPATFDDFYALYSSPEVEFAYGVIYGDDATRTASTFDEAFSHSTEQDKKSNCGIRGVIVYNVNTAKHVMFPIGGSGFGHRSAYATGDNGCLRYAGRKELMVSDLAESRPPFWNIMYSRGAIYWLAMPVYYSDIKEKNYQTETSPLHANSWDMNYKTMDFSHYGNNAYCYLTGSNPRCDAAYIRLVEE